MNIVIRVAILILIPIIIFGLFARHKKNKPKNEKIEEEAKQLDKTITETKQHLKYKNKIYIHLIIHTVSVVLILLYLLLMICLPIFQIKVDILGEKIVIKDFSFIDTANTLKKEYNASSNSFTDLDSKSFNISTKLGIAAIIILMIVEIFLSLVLYREKDVKDFYIEAKQNKKIGIFKIIDIILDIVMLLIPIIIYILGKNAEYKFKSDIPLTATPLDNYIYYYKNSGELAFRVYQNDFKFCNGVSGYIAIPIICFVVGLIMYIVGQYLKHKLIAEISNEKLDELQTVNTGNDNDNIE